MHNPGMKLFYSTASPYARKVVVAAREAGIIDQINIISTNANPVDPNQDIVAVNPIGKIPTLILDDGTALFDSRVICEYIASLSNDSGLYPDDNTQRARVQTIHAMGDGMLDAALLTRYETFLRPEEVSLERLGKGSTRQDIQCIGLPRTKYTNAGWQCQYRQYLHCLRASLYRI